MNDFAENIPISQKDLGLASSEVLKLNQIFSLAAIKSRAESVAWSRCITSSTVTFPRPDGKIVWGVEYNIPLLRNDTEDVYKDALKKYDKKNILREADVNILVEERRETRYYQGPSFLKLPDKIEKIRILDLSPQEGMPKGLRNIKSLRNWHNDKHISRRVQEPAGKSVIDKVMGAIYGYSQSDQKRKKALDNLFIEVFSENKKEVELFKSVVNNSQGRELLFIHAHGGNSNIIGEQTGPVVGKYANEKQAEGNWIDLTEVIERYDNPKTFAAILVNTCYFGKEKPPVRRVPVFRMSGISGLGDFPTFGFNKTLVSLPEGK